MKKQIILILVFLAMVGSVWASSDDLPNNFKYTKWVLSEYDDDIYGSTEVTFENESFEFKMIYDGDTVELMKGNKIIIDKKSGGLYLYPFDFIKRGKLMYFTYHRNIEGSECLQLPNTELPEGCLRKE